MQDTRTFESSREARAAIRSGRWRRPTPGMVPSAVQANLVILPQADAGDFWRFCDLNPQPCPLLDMTEPGSPHPKRVAPDADLRTDLPRYVLYENGVPVHEVDDLNDVWRSDLVAFLLGCSFTFEAALIDAGVPMRHIENGCSVPMWKTNRECVPAGSFHGPLVVSMRPVPASLVDIAIEVTSRYPRVHGAPVHVGEPSEIGIDDLATPDWGDPPIIEDGDVPVFWACGVTPQAVAIASRPAFMATHAPGHMFVTDLTIDDLEGPLFPTDRVE